jgi:hypothetical protein
MFGGGPGAGRARAAATEVAKLLATSAGTLPIQAASISFIRAVSAARRSLSNFECFAKEVPPRKRRLG